MSEEEVFAMLATVLRAEADPSESADLRVAALLNEIGRAAPAALTSGAPPMANRRPGLRLSRRSS